MAGLPQVAGGSVSVGLPGRAESSSLERAREISQYGITWTFDREVSVGRFVNGDYYVVGPATIVEIDPPPLIGAEVPAAELDRLEQSPRRKGRHVRNGSMVNPLARSEVGFDSGIRNYFNPDLVDVPPIDLRPGDCIVSTISLKVGEQSRFPYHGDGGHREKRHSSPVKTAAVLTCLAEAVPSDAFRPSYGDRERKLYLARDLKRDLLPTLKPPANTPALSTWIRVYQRPWINPCFFGFEQPMENMPYYGQWVGQASSMAGLLLMLDLKPEAKEELLINVVQVGIDYWGLVRNHHPGWQGWGGHGSGRKFPIVFAGILLGDDEMAAPTRTFPAVEFGEDNQTMYGDGWTGATALFAGHSGIQSATGKPERPKWGPYEHLHPSEWTESQLQSEEYRRANASSSWVGQALVIRLLGKEDCWGHDAFFDYVDRWMTESGDREHRLEIMKHHPEFRGKPTDRVGWQGQTAEPFVESMWNRYREAAPVSPQADQK